MSLGGLTGGGLTGSGGGSIAGGVAAPSETKADASLLISYAKSEGARKEGDKPGGDASGTDIHADLTTEEQNRKLQDFAAVQGRPNFGQRQQDEQQREVRLAQASIGTMSDALPEVVGSGPGSTRIPLEDAGQAGDGALPTMGNIAKKGLKTGGPVGAAASVLLGSTNSNHDQTLTIPGHPQYRITGKEDMVGRTLEVQNADGGWEPIGTISVGGVQGGPTTVDMTEVNDVLKDRGFEPVDLGDTSLPGTPIDGPKGPSILSTPDQGGESIDILTTPNAGPRGAEVLSTPVPEEQGPQILNVEIDTGHILDGEVRDGQAKGFHHREGGFDPVDSQLDEITALPDKNGIYEGEVSVRDPETRAMVPKDAPSTFFPDDMTKGEVEQAIKNAYEKRYDQRRSEGPFEGPSGEGFKIRGRVEDGVAVAAWPLRVPGG